MAKHITGRTGQQCAQRWRHRVNPSINKEKWTPEEDRQLFGLVLRHGNFWAEIARGLKVCWVWVRGIGCRVQLSVPFERHGNSWAEIAHGLKVCQGMERGLKVY